MNIFPSFPSSDFEDELAVDIFVFNADGTGVTEETAITFDWTIEADGHLSVTMANGESADYSNMGRSNNGDIISAAYQLTAPLFPGEDTLIHVVRLSFDKVAATVPTTQAGYAGIYTGTFAYDIPDPVDNDLDYFDDVFVRLNPDGTGSREGYFFNQMTNQIEFAAELQGFCWQVDGDGDLQIDFVDALGVSYFPMSVPDFNLFRNSVEPDPTFCGSLSPSTILERVFSTTLRVDGAVFSDFQNILIQNMSTFVLETNELGMAVSTRTPLTVNPPIAFPDDAFYTIGIPETIDVTANDIERNGPAIDPATVQIVSGPYKGTATVDPVTGVVTYTSNPGVLDDSIQYRVFDTAGNPSTIGRIDLYDAGM